MSSGIEEEPPVKKLIYEFDEQLIFYDVNGVKLPNGLSDLLINTQNYNLEKSISEPFPSDHTLFKFACLAYTDSEFAIPKHWRILTSARSEENGYYGVAFWNRKLRQVVVANKGTDDLLSYLADLSILFNGKPNQARSASTFIHKLKKALKKELKNEYYQLSITGHSLGGWLAQIQTFTIKYLIDDVKNFVRDNNFLNNVHAHTVVFESPGCRDGLRKLTHNYQQGLYGDFKTLDITTYLSQPNIVNRCLEHTGLIFYMTYSECTHKKNVTEKSLLKYVLIQIKSILSTNVCDVLVPGHSSDEIKKWFDDPTAKKVILINFRTGKIPIKFKGDLQIKTYKPYECSLNVFDYNQLKNLLIWSELKNLKLDLSTEEKEYQIPIFKIDTINHKISANNESELLKTIGQINHISNFSTIINSVLDKSDINFEGLVTIAQEIFKRKIITFENIHFEDVYKLKLGLSENNFIFISFAESLNNLEASIINNILANNTVDNNETISQYLENYAFLRLECMSLIKNIIRRSKVSKLLILEISNGTEEDILRIKQYAEESEKIKIIFLVLNGLQISTECQKGIADNIKLEHLTQKSQNIIFQKVTSISEEASFSGYNELLRGFFTSEILTEILFNTRTQETSFFKNHLHASIGMQHETVKKIENNNEFVKYIEKSVDQCLFIVSETDNSLPIPEFSNVIDLRRNGTPNFLSKVTYWITINNKFFYVHKIYDKDLYLPRKISNTTITNYHNKIVDKDCINKLNDQTFILINVNMENKNTFEFKNEHVSTVTSVKAANEEFVNGGHENVHIFKIQDTNLVWWKSKGDIDCLREYITSETSVEENNFIEKLNDDKIVIISDKSGTGKSAITSHICLQLQTKLPLVFLISLKSCSDQLKKLINPKVTIKLATEFLFDASKMLPTKLDKALLAYSLQPKNLPVYILFDGFNEIYDDQQADAFIKLTKYLINQTSAKVLITVRRDKKKLLEDELSVFSSELEKLKDSELIRFCSKFWYNQLILTQENVDTNKLKEYAKYLLDYAKSKLSGEIVDFFGIPLQLKLAAQIITPNCELQNFMRQLNFKTVFELYQKYILVHYNKYFERYLIAEQDSEYIRSSMQERINSSIGKIAVLVRFKYDVDKIDNKEIRALTSIGIVQALDDSICFSHDTITDYYLAEWLIRWLSSNCVKLEEEKLFVTDIFVKPEFSILRYFFNDLLNITKLPKLNVKFEDIFNNDFIFQNGVSLLHVAVSEELIWVLEKFLLKLFEGRDDLIRIFAKHNVDEETVLNLACKINANGILSRLWKTLNTLADENIEEMLLATIFHVYEEEYDDKLIKSINKNCTNVHNAFKIIKEDFEKKSTFLKITSETGYVVLDEKDLQKYYEIKKSTLMPRYLQLIKKTERQVALHLAAISGDEGLVRDLIELNCELNVKDYHGMTPLARAAQKGHIETVSVLINSGARDDIYDDSNVSPFMHATKHGYEDILRIMINGKRSEEIEKILLHRDIHGKIIFTYAIMQGYTIIAKYLIELANSCKNGTLKTVIDSADNNGLTPIQYVTKGIASEQLTLAKLLVKHGATLNTCSESLVTPLLRAIWQKKWDLVNYLIKEGANVNGKTKDGTCMLSLLLANNRNNIVKVMVKKYNADTTNLSVEEQDKLKIILNSNK